MNKDIKIDVNLSMIQCTRCGEPAAYSNAYYTEPIFCTDCFDANAERRVQSHGRTARGPRDHGPRRRDVGWNWRRIIRGERGSCENDACGQAIHR